MLDIDQFANEYFQEVVRDGPARTEAFDRFGRLLDTDPDFAWKVSLRLLALAKTTHDLAVIGSGPLEDLLVRFPEVLVERVIIEVQKNVALQRALEFVRIGEDEIPPNLFDTLAEVRRSSR